MSFYTSLSGLKASQVDMASISHNLANVGTTGFKKSRAEFADVIASNLAVAPTQMVGSGTVVKGNRQQFGEGNLVQSSSSLDIAIAGDGFLALKQDPTKDGLTFTRNGSLRVDANQFVTDAQGARLQVYPVDGSGNVVATTRASLTDLVLASTSGKPAGTNNVSLDLNMNARSVVPDTAKFDRFDSTSYNESIATTVYDGAGNPMTMTTYLKRTTAPVVTTPPAAEDLSSTWEAYSFVGDQPLTTGSPAAQAVPVQFDNTGKLTTAVAATFNSFMPASGVAQQQITLNIPTTSAATTKPFKFTQGQDGIAVGRLQGVTINEKGIVTASYSNGDTKALGQVAIVNFSNSAGLRQMGNSNWQATGLSGDPSFASSGENGAGSLMSGMIEGSNVDITEELVSLIAAQRNFQANSKALDTSNQITRSILDLRA
ncbi:flagellar hook-basal body protein [Sphingomonas sp. Leaf23]|uniref:flagellar hook protein FlgE n=1 Tax=Sphingomonas sp. Leaf23 TaxID=1735689 RepID=UPI0006F83C3C|nr:flagellar hook protein FlgE [Sphingomonas sp. Leaf23]KQM87484.1 flagellar hook-basal body protein [Sphingomonas sp. Leaf23]